MKLALLSAFLQLAAVTADQVLVLSSTSALLHKSSDVRPQQPFTEAGLAQLALNSLGASGARAVRESDTIEAVVPPVANALQADVFQSAGAYAMLLVENAPKDLLTQIRADGAWSSSESFGQSFRVTDGVTSGLPAVIAARLGSVTAHCVGSSTFCKAPLTQTQVNSDEVQKVLDENKFLSTDEQADKDFATELSQLNHLTSNFPQVSKDFFAIQISAWSKLSAAKQVASEKLLTKSIESFLAKLKQANVPVGAQVISYNAATQVTNLAQDNRPDVAYARMLLGTASLAKNESASSNKTSNATASSNGTSSSNFTTSDLTLQDIAEYQIVLWTAVGLAFILFLVILSMCNMDVGRDSLLYAKFTTDAAHRKGE